MSTQPITLDMSTAQPLQAPVKLDMSTAQPLPGLEPSAASRLRDNFLSGLGITNDEGAKNFFEHPIKTAMASIDAQAELGRQAKVAYDAGDYKSAVIHGLNYLVPFIGQQTDKAGRQMSQGDIAGGVGRTLGVTAPMVAGSPEARAAASDAASAAAPTASHAARMAVKTGTDVVGDIPIVRQILKVKKNWDATAAPTPQPTPEAAAAPTPASPTAAAPIAPTTPAAQPAEIPATGSGAGIPRTLSGESSLRQILTGQDNANLMKIAKSRGINVTQEAQLKPGFADNRLVNKIVDDFSDDELDGIRSQYLENTRMGKHNFGDIGPEAQKVLSLQSYFPDVKLSAAAVKRTAAAIAGGASQPAASATPANADLTPQLEQMLKQVQARKRTLKEIQ